MLCTYSWPLGKEGREGGKGDREERARAAEATHGAAGPHHALWAPPPTGRPTKWTRRANKLSFVFDFKIPATKEEA